MIDQWEVAKLTKVKNVSSVIVRKYMNFLALFQHVTNYGKGFSLANGVRFTKTKMTTIVEDMFICIFLIWYRSHRIEDMVELENYTSRHRTSLLFSSHSPCPCSENEKTINSQHLLCISLSVIMKMTGWEICKNRNRTSTSWFSLMTRTAI